MLITEHKKRLDISFDNDAEADISLYKDIYGSHIAIGDEVLGDYPEITKVEDYLYEITVDEMDEEYVVDFLRTPAGYCSEVRNGNFIGRNFDWVFSNDVEFIVRTLPQPGRYASIGVCNSLITKAEMDAKKYSEHLKLVPFEMNDGINECGVYCGINIVPRGDKGLTIGTNPGLKKLPNVAIPRFVLDKASSAKEAVALLNTRDIYSIVYGDEAIETHVLIADAEDTFIVEFIDNKLVAIPYEDKKAIMTNFYLSGWNGEIKAKWLGNTDEEIKTTGLTDHADGLERYLILEDGLDSVTSIDSAIDLMKSVFYTKAYDTTMNPFWYSELTGTLGRTIYSTEEDFAPIVDVWVQMYEHRERENSQTWQTVHCSCYDIANKSFKIIAQEGSTEHEYSLNVN